MGEQNRAHSGWSGGPGVVLSRVRVCALLTVCLGIVVACGRPRPTPIRLPTPTIEVRHIDALPLMASTAQALAGDGYQALEEHRLERGLGWGEDTTRLSGYRTVFGGGGGAFSQVVCQIECYLSVEESQQAYRAYRETLTSRLQGNPSYGPMIESEEEQLGDWNHKYAVSAEGSAIVHYIFLRENVLVEFAFTGPESPTFPDQAARQARVLDKQIYSR
jgi:hypothetical protein